MRGHFGLVVSSKPLQITHCTTRNSKQQQELGVPICDLDGGKIQATIRMAIAMAICGFMCMRC
jgi:hypothetical protein